jgi:hypothetical protein
MVLSSKPLSIWRWTAVVVVLVATAGCDDSPANRMIDPDTPIVLDIRTEDENGTARTRFDPGQPIRFVLEIRNVTLDPVEMRFPSRKVFDFVVTNDNGATIWVWSADKAFLDAVTRITFDPATTENVRVIWDQLRSDGRRAFHGTYQVRGLLPAADGYLESRPVSFRIQ